MKHKISLVIVLLAAAPLVASAVTWREWNCSSCQIETPTPSATDVSALNVVLQNNPTYTQVWLCNPAVAQQEKASGGGCATYTYDSGNQSWYGVVTGLSEPLCEYVWKREDLAPCEFPPNPADEPHSTGMTYFQINSYLADVGQYGYPYPGGKVSDCYFDLGVFCQ